MVDSTRWISSPKVCDVVWLLKSLYPCCPSTRSAVDVLTKTQALEPLVVRWLNAKFRLDRDKSDKSMKFGTQLAYILLKDIRRGAQVKLLIFSF